MSYSRRYGERAELERREWADAMTDRDHPALEPWYEYKARVEAQGVKQCDCCGAWHTTKICHWCDLFQGMEEPFYES